MIYLYHGIIYIKNTGISIYYCYPVLVPPEHLSNISLSGFAFFYCCWIPRPRRQMFAHSTCENQYMGGKIYITNV